MSQIWIDLSLIQTFACPSNDYYTGISTAQAFIKSEFHKPRVMIEPWHQRMDELGIRDFQFKARADNAVAMMEVAV
ncbi:hypothetical protein RvY_09242 [Ramazzottius varieornatus]|uniref:Uncharacterized protein n=1 Tax=Ramazzottius varieornatus TaxID=947166 RepID=A0A1D1V8L7_RAMVA|nr:hypothetical protein RvY_09242 [Ramazzottius varieornatus]